MKCRNIYCVFKKGCNRGLKDNEPWVVECYKRCEERKAYNRFDKFIMQYHSEYGAKWQQEKRKAKQ